MLKIGVTGGIGSGKSTVCRLFSNLGLPVFYSDEVAKEIYNTNASVRKKIKRLLGEQAYDESGKLNRGYVASKIFNNKRLRESVESIIHPLVKKEREKKYREWKEEGHKIVIIESALIFEKGLHKELDAVIVVEADVEKRIKRICARDSVSYEDVKLRIGSQLDSKKRVEKADYLIYNNGSIEELEANVNFLYNLFKKLADEE